MLRCVVAMSLFRGACGQSPCATYEAEDAAASGPNLISNHKGFTGAGFMDYDAATEDLLEWTVVASVSTSWRFVLGIRISESRDLRLSVNDVPLQTVSFPGTGGDWSTYINTSASEVMVTLGPGDNTIRLTAIGDSGGDR